MRKTHGESVQNHKSNYIKGTWKIIALQLWKPQNQLAYKQFFVLFYQIMQVGNPLKYVCMYLIWQIAVSLELLTT